MKKLFALTLLSLILNSCSETQDRENSRKQASFNQDSALSYIDYLDKAIPDANGGIYLLKSDGVWFIKDTIARRVKIQPTSARFEILHVDSAQN